MTFELLHYGWREPGPNDLKVFLADDVRRLVYLWPREADIRHCRKQLRRALVFDSEQLMIQTDEKAKKKTRTFESRTGIPDTAKF